MYVCYARNFECEGRLVVRTYLDGDNRGHSYLCLILMVPFQHTLVHIQICASHTLIQTQGERYIYNIEYRGEHYNTHSR